MQGLWEPAARGRVPVARRRMAGAWLK